MNPKTVTLRDVAEKAKVSQSTVSRVLNSSVTQIPISQKTRQRVEKAVKELGYRPHPGARSLSGRGTGLIGLIMREINDPFFAELVDVISNVAKQKGYELVLGNAKRNPEHALALRDRMLDPRHCDGLLLCGDLEESPEDHTFLDKMGMNHRLVSVSRGRNQLVRSTPSVAIDNNKGTLLVLEYLAQLGHERIACVNASRVGDLWERLEAYRDFMRDRFGGVPEDYVQLTENRYEGGYQATNHLLSLTEPPTAIFAMDDTMAIGALSAAADRGYVVPTDISIVGFDDMDVCAYLRPALTTVRQPTDELGRKAVELLLNMINGQESFDPIPRLFLDPELVIRDSCGPPAN